MRKFLFAISAVIVLACAGQYAMTKASGPYPAALGGLGTSQIPASGTIPIGNGAGSYTPALLTPGSNVTITDASGSVTISATAGGSGTTTTVNGVQGPTFTFSIVGTSSQSSITTTTASVFLNLLRYVSGTDINVAANGVINFVNTPGYISTSTGLTVNNFASPNLSLWTNNLGWISTSTGLTVNNFSSPNISQWTNDAGYVTSTGGSTQWSNVARGISYSAGTVQMQDYYTGTSSTVPQFVAVGDSLTAGLQCSSHQYTYYLSLPSYNGIPFNVTNIGIGGEDLIQIGQVAYSNWFPLQAYNSGMNIAILWAGTNDIGVGVTPSGTLSEMEQISNHARSLGWKVIVGTMISRNGYDPQHDALDALIRANWPSFADGIADFAADNRLGADGAYANGTWFCGDGAHLTDASYQEIVAPYVNDAVLRIVNRYRNEQNENVLGNLVVGTTTNQSSSWNLTNNLFVNGSSTFNGNVMFPNLTGTALGTDAYGNLIATTTTGGGATSPGGSSTQLQYNSSNTFAGIANTGVIIGTSYSGSSTVTASSVTFTTTGSVLSFTLPANVTGTVTVHMTGANGGEAFYELTPGGYGGSVTGTLSLASSSPGTTYYFELGCPGATSTVSGGGLGGCNGGGSGGSGAGGGVGAGGGGGMTWLSLTSSLSQSTLVMVAPGGGGGGSGPGNNGGNGGGLTGSDGSGTGHGLGATQTTGGSPGSGNNCTGTIGLLFSGGMGCSPSGSGNWAGGGAGAGIYGGGGGGGGTDTGGSGGGGSAFFAANLLSTSTAALNYDAPALITFSYNVVSGGTTVYSPQIGIGTATPATSLDIEGPQSTLFVQCFKTFDHATTSVVYDWGYLSSTAMVWTNVQPAFCQ